MRTIFLIFCFVIVVLAAACSPPFIIQFPEDDIEEINEPVEPKPEWINREYWEENGYIYAVGIAEKTSAGEDVQLRFAVIEAKKKILLQANDCHATIVDGVLLQSWTDSNGAVYVLVRAAEIIPWENCK